MNKREKYICKLLPYFKDTIWGWEKWLLSCHENGDSIIENGILKGSKFKDMVDNISDFPILVKIIKAHSVLSVQVHPDDNYAQIHENTKGKTECWYVLEAQEDSTLICGIKKGLDRNSLYNIIKAGKIEQQLEEIPVKKGDFIYIPSGTVHAIKGGLKLVEVQQNSDITYRLYDWERGRDIHIEKSLDVIDYKGENKGGKIENFKFLNTPYFSVEKISVNDKYSDCTQKDFHCYVVIEGTGSAKSNGDTLQLKEEETIYIPLGIEYELQGDMVLLKVISNTN